MIQVKVNTNDIDQLVKALTDLAYNKDKILRSVATTMRAEVSYRIHVEGKDAFGNIIAPQGYSDEYYEFRIKKLNREASKKVILSATGQMENDFQIVDTPDGYGLGFLNPHNYDKSKWVEETYERTIYAFTDEEEKLAQDTANHETERIINAIR